MHAHRAKKYSEGCLEVKVHTHAHTCPCRHINSRNLTSFLGWARTSREGASTGPRKEQPDVGKGELRQRCRLAANAGTGVAGWGAGRIHQHFCKGSDEVLGCSVVGKPM